MGSVGDIMQLTGSKFEEEQIIYITRCTLKGLAYLHARRKIHRDVKPGNLLVNAQGRIKLGEIFSLP